MLTDWRSGAACKGVDPAVFEGASYSRSRRGILADQRRLAEARTHCAGCPVMNDCLIDALADRWSEGVHGGQFVLDGQIYRLPEAPAAKPRKKAAERRNLQPCGSHSTYTRHVRRGEPVDDACRAAHAAYTTGRNQRTRYAKALKRPSRRRVAA